MLFFCGPENRYMVICGDHSCEKYDEIRYVRRNGSNIRLFPCELAGMASSTCIYGTGTSGDTRCLNVNTNSSLFRIAVDHSNPLLEHMVTHQNTCHLEVISLNNSANDITMSDVYCSDNYTFICYTECPIANKQIKNQTEDHSRIFSSTFLLFGLVYIIGHLCFQYTIWSMP